jgi:hypothetical protein
MPEKERLMPGPCNIVELIIGMADVGDVDAAASDYSRCQLGIHCRTGSGEAQDEDRGMDGSKSL